MMLNIKVLGPSKLILCCLIVGFNWAFAKSVTPAEELVSYKKLYPKESGVITDSWRKYDISQAGDSLRIVVDQYQEILVLENPSGWIKDHVYSSSFKEIFELDAYTLVPGKKKYKKVKVEAYQKSYDKETYVFYDDTQVINYQYPQVEIGSKIVTRQQWVITDPRLIGQFFFSSYIPTVKNKLSIITDANVSIIHGLYNEELAKINYQSTAIENGRVQHTYSAVNIDNIEYRDDNPSFHYLSPSVYLTIAGYVSNEMNIDVLASIDDLHGWYSTFIESLAPDEAVIDLANEIVSGTDDDYDKIRKLFYWVQSNVKYIAFEQGMRGLIPHQPDYVLQKRYGDCKDMSSLLVGLLKSQGLPASYTWIGSRKIPYKYSEIASPIVDDHMIASVEHDGETIFLDATGSYTPIGFPTAMIQGKESLINAEGVPKIMEVPIIAREKNMMIDSAYVRLEDGEIKGVANLELTGLVKVANTYKLVNKSSKGEENYLKRLLSKGSNKFFLDSYVVKNVEDLDKAIKIAYDFRIDDYYNAVGDEIYVNLCLDKSLTDGFILDRTTPIENDYKYINRSVTILEIPDGYTVSYLPEASALETDNFGYAISYDLMDNKLYATKEFYVDYLMMYPKDFKTWNDALKTYAQAIRNTVVLTNNRN